MLLLLVSWIIIKPAAGQLSPCGNCTFLEVDNFLNDKEHKVELLSRHALFLQLAAESTDCGLSNCVDKCSRHSCSPTTKDKFTCVKAPSDVRECTSSVNSSAPCDHLKVDFTRNGFVRVPPQFQNFSDLSPELTRSICAQTNLQFSASSESISSELTFWNYYGSAEGAWRGYPGRVCIWAAQFEPPFRFESNFISMNYAQSEETLPVKRRNRCNCFIEY